MSFERDEAPEEARKAESPLPPQQIEALFTGQPLSIASLSHRIMAQCHGALVEHSEQDPVLAQALQFHAIYPNSIAVNPSRKSPDEFTVDCTASVCYATGSPSTVLRPMRLLSGVRAGQPMSDICDEAAYNLSSHPQDALAYLLLTCDELPEKVHVLPSTNDVTSLCLSEDTRFGFDCHNRRLPDPRSYTDMRQCKEKYWKMWEELQSIADREGVVRVGVRSGGEANPWNLQIFPVYPNPLKRFQSLLYPKGTEKPQGVSMGGLNINDGWEEKFDEIYPYDQSRLDFASEAIENVHYWVRQLLTEHDNVHVQMQLEGSSNTDIIVTFYAKNDAPA